MFTYMCTNCLTGETSRKSANSWSMAKFFTDAENRLLLQRTFLLKGGNPRISGSVSIMTMANQTSYCTTL